MKKRYIFLLAVLLFVLLNAFFFFIRPENIVDSLGVENTYLIAFLVAAIGGILVVGSPAFFSTILAFSAGGANLWLLTLSGGLGLFISDSVFFFLAYFGRRSVSSQWEEKISKFENKLQKLPEWIAFLILFILVGFTPIPNDILMIAMAIGGYKYLRFFPYLLAGNITITFLTARIGEIIW